MKNGGLRPRDDKAQFLDEPYSEENIREDEQEAALFVYRDICRIAGGLVPPEQVKRFADESVNAYLMLTSNAEHKPVLR